MRTFNPGDRVYHKAVGSKELGTVLEFNRNRTMVDWDIGTNIRRVVGGAGRHDTTYLVLLQPAFSEYDPTQVGDREDDI